MFFIFLLRRLTFFKYIAGKSIFFVCLESKSIIVIESYFFYIRNVPWKNYFFKRKENKKKNIIVLKSHILLYKKIMIFQWKRKSK